MIFDKDYIEIKLPLAARDERVILEYKITRIDESATAELARRMTEAEQSMSLEHKIEKLKREHEWQERLKKGGGN